jgi:iron-sulfur cluster repair protein YtfE (RIC family)
MDNISEFMELDHKRCDEEFAAAEDAVLRRDWSVAAGALATFVDDLESHFRAEEEVLFPAYESTTGMTGGPTQVMRMEHEQMRGLVRQMKEGVAARDGNAFGGSAETLLILMQQHNMKEENMLYPMCDQALGGDAALMGRLEQALRVPTA